jgi:DNA polymerase-3 subunit epsilon/ATP-dependent DNA helicase DinG
MSRIYIALDLEFTGLNPERDTILEVGAVKFRQDQVLDKWSCLVNPGRALPAKVSRLTGITAADLERAPSFRSLVPSLTRFVGEYPLVGHNVGMDLVFLKNAQVSLPNPALDTFELACILMPYASRYTLARLAQELGIEFPSRHRGLDDAQATHLLFLRLLDRAAQLNPKVLEEITRITEKSDWPIKLAFQDILRDHVRQAFQPGTIGAQLKAKGLTKDESLGVELTRDKDAKPLKPREDKRPVDVDQLEALLKAGGALAKKFPGYEYRPEQIKMLRAVAEAFDSSGTLLVEAGTGTGKSLAYLLPAIYWATMNNERVVISTNTINLQDQLFGKDVPALKHILPFEFRDTILKGRSNYLCRTRFDAMRHQQTHTLDEIKLMVKVLAWLPSTMTGDVAELTLTFGEQAVWARVCSHPDYCTPERCGRRKDPCFFWRARAAAESSHLVIINHALLLSDMAMENRVLPEFKYLIVDEAHHLEARATEALAFEASKSSFDLLLRSIGSERSGLLTLLAGSVRRSEAPISTQREFQQLIEQTTQAVERTRGAVYEYFNLLERFFAQQEDGPGDDNSYERQIRLTMTRRNQPDWDNAQIAWEPFDVALADLLEKLEKIYRAWNELDNYEIANHADSWQDIMAQQRALRDIRSAVNQAINEPKNDSIYWATINQRSGDVALHAAPLHVGAVLQKNMFATRETVILTSATLRIADSFAYIKNRLGLGEWADELAVGSPFDYRQAALVYVPTDVPEPGQPGYQKAVEGALVDLLKATEGRALVLFTSHSQLQATYRSISRRLEEAEIFVLAQGLDGSRRQVLDTFKTNERMALFGTKSFWEGVDVVGEALSCLVMARLPFSVPSDPIFAARSETFDDAFGQYAVPEAVLRFRQGFGRLIRSQSDRGIVVILDKRVLTKNYGTLFIESLPDCSKKQGPLKELPGIARDWIGQAGVPGAG